MTGFFGAISALFLNRPATDTAADESDATAVQPASRGTILVIDDDQSLLDILRPILREAGFTVMTSPSGAKGLDLLRYAQKDIRVVLLDYNMPRLSGAETLQHLRRVSPTTKVIALSGIAVELLPEEFRTGADRFLAKPFRSVELVRTIDSLLTAELPKVAA